MFDKFKQLNDAMEKKMFLKGMTKVLSESKAKSPGSWVRECCGNCQNFDEEDGYCYDRGLSVGPYSFPDYVDYCGCPFFSRK